MKKQLNSLLAIALLASTSSAIANTTNDLTNRMSPDKNIQAPIEGKLKLEPLSPYGNPPSYKVFGKRYQLMNTNKDFQQRGTASWYGPQFHGHRTSSGEIYDMFGFTAAHKSLPIPCYVRVTNLENGKQLIVKVNDRGPFHNDRIIDLSYTAAKKLGVVENGTARVQIDGIAPFQYVDSGSGEQLFLQIGAFNHQSNATQYAKKIEKITDHPVNVFSANFDGKNIYRVKIGPLHDEWHGRVINKLLETAGFSHGTLVRV